MDGITYIKKLKEFLDRIPHDQIDIACEKLEELRRRGNTLFLFGNGGSAALASHLACDLSKGVEEPPFINVNCLNDHVAEMTAIANDESYDHIFSGQLAKQMRQGDMVFAISTSGNSKNVVRGLQCAHEKGAESIGLLGFEGGKAKKWVTYPIIIPDTSVQRLEDIHLVITHIIYLKMLETATSKHRSTKGVCS